MHQRLDLHREQIATSTFFEDFKRRTISSGDVAELYHENSKQSARPSAKLTRSVGEFQRAYLRYIQTLIKPDYRGHQLLTLPTPPAASDIPCAEIIRSRRSPQAFATNSIDIDTIGTLLHTAISVTGVIETEHPTKSLRAYPSAGALYPVEVYIGVRASRDLATGLYYYTPDHHGLRVLDTGSQPELLDAFVDDSVATAAPLIILLTGVFWRSKAKYGPRGYRYTLLEAGHIAANIGITAEALGLTSRPIGGFDDDLLNESIGIDGVNEAAIYAVPVGTAREETSDGG